MLHRVGSVAPRPMTGITLANGLRRSRRRTLPGHEVLDRAAGMRATRLRRSSARRIEVAGAPCGSHVSSVRAS